MLSFLPKGTAIAGPDAPEVTAIADRLTALSSNPANAKVVELWSRWARLKALGKDNSDIDSFFKRWLDNPAAMNNAAKEIAGAIEKIEKGESISPVSLPPPVDIAVKEAAKETVKAAKNTGIVPPVISANMPDIEKHWDGSPVKKNIDWDMVADGLEAVDKPAYKITAVAIALGLAGIIYAVARKGE